MILKEPVDNPVEKARIYATSTHARINQLRKYSLLPYDVHLGAVAKLVASVSTDQAMICAAWLHDTVEDTPATFDDLEREFGSDVMNLVKELTDISKPGDGNRATRREADRLHLTAGSPRAKTIKLADIIDNCEDICRQDPKFGRVYLTEAQALLDVLKEGDQRLYAKAVKTLSKWSQKLGSNYISASTTQIQQPVAIDDKRPFSGRHGMRLFAEAFTARDILEPLLSFDENYFQNSGAELDRPTAPVIGIRCHGAVTGFLSSDDFSTTTSPKARPFEQRQIVDLDTSLADVIHVLTHFAFCFVQLGGTVIGVIGRDDINKPVVRMWLFGIIILIEVQVVELIRASFPDQSWIDLLSEGRREKARTLQAERARRGLDADLLDCLQFSDKLQIAIMDHEFMEIAGFGSTSGAKKALKDMESLRNHLAHGQDITTHDWPPIIRLARRVQDIYCN